MALQTGIFAELLAEESRALALRREERSSLENPQTPLSFPAEWLLDIFNGGRTDSGIRVSELTAFQAMTFLSCVDLIAGKISSFPWHVYERQFSQTGRAIHRIAYDHAYYDLLNTEPNDEMSWQTLLYALLAHALAWPGAYVEIQRDAGNQAVAFWPRNPAKTRPIRLMTAMRLEPEPWRPFPVDLPAGKMAYRTTDGLDDHDTTELQQNLSRAQRIIPAEDMIHVPGLLPLDGRIGQGVVYLARQTIGLILATEKFGAKYFANFAKPGGILETPSSASPGTPAHQKAKESWQEAQGGENAHRVAVMPPGFKFTPMSHNPQEAQAVEMRTFLRTEMAAVFHVPARMVGDQAKSSRASTEQENQELYDFALVPPIGAVKQEFKRKVFPHRGIGRTPKNRLFLDCDVTDFIRGDAASREKFNASGKQWGYLNTNDVRALEKLNPIEEPWAEEYWMPVNMTLATTPIDPTHQDGAGNGEVPASGVAAVGAYSLLFRDAVGRMVTREKRDLSAIRNCFSPILYTLREHFGLDAQREMRTIAPLGPDSDRFISSYLESMEQRARAWSTDKAEKTAREELARAARAIRVAVYREIAAGKAVEAAEIS